MIDRLRKEIQDRLDQLLSEAERLRRALVALDPRGGSSTAAPKAAAPSAAASKATGAASPGRPNRRTKSVSGARPRTAPGQTKSAVLGALSNGNGMTAGEVAAATGLARGTVSTTLSKLARNGEVVKAQRGYSLPPGQAATASASAPAETSGAA